MSIRFQIATTKLCKFNIQISTIKMMKSVTLSRIVCTYHIKACCKPLYISRDKSKSIFFCVSIPKVALRRPLNERDSLTASLDLEISSCLCKKLARNVPIDIEPRNVRSRGQVVDDVSVEVDP